MTTPFFFATGIENSYPTIPTGRRVDEMEKCGHYKLWREDLERNRENGWALAGLAAALERQSKTAEAEQVRARLSVAWARADLGLERVPAGR